MFEGRPACAFRLPSQLSSNTAKQLSPLFPPCPERFLAKGSHKPFAFLFLASTFAQPLCFSHLREGVGGIPPLHLWKTEHRKLVLPAPGPVAEQAQRIGSLFFSSLATRHSPLPHSVRTVRHSSYVPKFQSLPSPVPKKAGYTPPVRSISERINPFSVRSVSLWQTSLRRGLPSAQRSLGQLCNVN
jgi:hypothetical protein